MNCLPRWVVVNEGFVQVYKPIYRISQLPRGCHVEYFTEVLNVVYKIIMLMRTFNEYFGLVNGVIELTELFTLLFIDNY